MIDMRSLTILFLLLFLSINVSADLYTGPEFFVGEFGYQVLIFLAVIVFLYVILKFWLFKKIRFK